MEHDGEDGGRPMDIRILGLLALKCRSYAKALHYKEREYNTRGGGSCIEDIISVNKKLDMPGKLASLYQHCLTFLNISCFSVDSKRRSCPWDIEIRSS